MKNNIKNIVMYIFSVFFILLALVSLTMGDTFIYKIYSFTLLLMYAAIFAIIADFKGIRKYIPLFNKNKIGYTALGVIACITILIAYAGIFNSFYDIPEKQVTTNNTASEQNINRETNNVEEKEKASDIEKAQDNSSNKGFFKRLFGLSTNEEKDIKDTKKENNKKEIKSTTKKETAKKTKNAKKKDSEYEYIYNTLEKGNVPKKALKKTADIFYKCGLIDIEDVELSIDDKDLKFYRCWYKDDNRLQINFTYENYNELFYVQLTGLHKVENDFYRNWRGKIKYGIVDKQVSVDMYDYGIKAKMDYEKNIVYPYKYRNEENIEKYSVPIDTDR